MSNYEQWADFVPHLTADDLRGQAVKATIESVSSGEYYNRKTRELEVKPRLHFKGKRKYLIVSNTNRDALRAAFGAKVGDVIGKTIVLKTETVKVGHNVETPIRIGVPKTQPTAQAVDLATGEVMATDAAADAATAPGK
jgi:hypothetical protein